MIRNERQYRVTQMARKRLLSQIEEAANSSAPLWVVKASTNALTTQALLLDAEMSDYNALRSGAFGSVNVVNDLKDLPHALIRSRIAANLTQKELADLLQLREQQIQKYEANDYAGASIQRLEQVMQALGVTFQGSVALPVAGTDGSELRRSLSKLGLSKSVLDRRIFGYRSGTSSALGSANSAARAARIFNVELDEVMSGDIPQLANVGSFRAAANANVHKINAYARYAEYLAELLLRTCANEYRPFPSADELRASLGNKLAVDPLESLVRECWERGIPVLPLADSGAFYGACWEIGDRPAIALKHGVRSPDRWAFLLAHEIYHSRNLGGESVVEAEISASEWRALPEEQAADDYASHALLGTDAEAMLHVATEQANGDIAQLKSALPPVAAAGGVSLGVLADFAATRVGMQGINWWPTANRLHQSDKDAWAVCRSMLFEYVDFSQLDALDREILIDGIGL